MKQAQYTAGVDPDTDSDPDTERNQQRQRQKHTRLHGLLKRLTRPLRMRVVLRRETPAVLCAFTPGLVQAAVTAAAAVSPGTRIIGSERGGPCRFGSRQRTLKRLLAAKPISRFIETHSPLSALIAEKVCLEMGEKVRWFDGFWSSSLTDSTCRGKPDIAALDLSSRLANVNDIFDVEPGSRDGHDDISQPCLLPSRTLRRPEPRPFTSEAEGNKREKGLGQETLDVILHCEWKLVSPLSRRGR